MKQYYFLKLNPCRPTFAQDMSDEEKLVMLQHVTYWKALMGESKVVVFGPVFDPAGAYGIGVVEAESEAAVQDFIAHDPASQLNRYEYFPMRAILPS